MGGGRHGGTERLDFVGIGVQKAATSWLFTCLEEHPGIASSRATSNKELNFFNHNWELGYRWLHNQFEFGDRLCGEFTSRYFHDANVPGRVAAYRPDIKLLLVLREPVARALSQHRHEMRRLRVPPGFTFPDALEENPSYFEQGRYATHLERWRGHFDDSQFLVLLYDDVSADPVGTVRRVFRFLGVDDQVQPPSATKRVNAPVTYRWPALARASGRLSVAVERSLGGRALKGLVSTGVPAVVRRLNSSPVDGTDGEAPDESVLGQLRNSFADEVERLEKLIGRDLASWK